MKDEYLWQKTGDDPEIMELEKTLATFRYRETDPPALSVQRSEARSSRGRFSLGFATAAFAAVAVAATVWLQISDPSTDYEVTFVHQPIPEIVESTATNPQPHLVPAVTPEKQPVEKQPVRRGRVEAQSAAARATRRQVAPKAHLAKANTPNLTKEEQDAYNQVVLALSITSSKLSIVRNTIDGVEATDRNHR